MSPINKDIKTLIYLNNRDFSAPFHWTRSLNQSTNVNEWLPLNFLQLTWISKHTILFTSVQLNSNKCELNVPSFIQNYSKWHKNYHTRKRNVTINCDTFEKMNELYVNSLSSLFTIVTFAKATNVCRSARDAIIR